MTILHGSRRIYKYLFGPVVSRRLGISLGIDLMPHKTCTLNCIYCECGKTTHLTIKRGSYVPVQQVREELKTFLSTNPRLDFATFSGFGEPVLHDGIGEIIRFLKKDFSQYKTALLTNGTLLYNPGIIKDILDLDLVKISLDAASEEVFYKINRPHPGLDFCAVIDGIVSFCKEFKNELLIEVFLVPGVNDGMAELKKIKELLSRIRPHKIQINTLDRPGAEDWVQPLDAEQLSKITSYLDNAETIDASALSEAGQTVIKDYYNRLLTTIQRRPVTAEDIAQLTGLQKNKIMDYLAILTEDGKIEKKAMPRGIFYKIKT